MKKLLLSLGGGLAVFALAMPAFAADIQWQLVQTLNIPANTTTPTASLALLNGTQYKVSVEGTFQAGDGIVADAKYSIKDGVGPWTDSVRTYESYGEQLLDLFMGSDNDWGDYSSTHKYSKEIIGAGSPLNFHIYDIYPSNNSGGLTVKIYSARYAEITAPTSGQDVFGNVDFKAYLYDDDADAIQWAVRRGTCAAGTNTIFGNVDSHSDVAAIDNSDLSNQTFSFTGNMYGLPSGMYCFIYNPVEDSGEANIRKTVEFNLVETIGPPTDKNQCKNNGWETFNYPFFKNQGDCVSYVQSNPNATGNRKDNQ